MSFYQAEKCHSEAQKLVEEASQVKALQSAKEIAMEQARNSGPSKVLGPNLPNLHPNSRALRYTPLP